MSTFRAQTAAEVMEGRYNLRDEYDKVQAELVKVVAELVKVERQYKDYRETNRAKVESLKKDAETCRIYNDAIFQEWIQGKIRMYENKDESDTITLDLPYTRCHGKEYPDFIHFLRGMEDEGEGSSDVFSDNNGDDWFVKEVVIKEEKSTHIKQKGEYIDITTFKVVVEKVITYFCTICEDYQVRGSMMTNGFDCHICEDCYGAFETMG